MKPKSAFTIAVLLSCVALFASCTGSQNPPSPGQPGTITVYAWDAIWTDSVMADLSAKVSADVPEIEGLKLAKVPWSDFINGLNVRLLGSNIPEVVTMHPSYKDDYMDNDRLVDLKPYIDQFYPDFDLGDFDQTILSGWSRPAGCSWKSGAAVPCVNLYGAPYHMLQAFTMFNKTAYDQAGLQTPDVSFDKGEWTWERARSDAKALVDSGAVKWGFAASDLGVFSSNGWLTLQTLYYPHGAAPFTPDGQTCTFDSPEMVKATELYWDMTFADGSIPLPGATIAFSSFANGEVGIQQSGYQLPTAVAAKAEDIEFEYGIAPPLAGPAGWRPIVQDKAFVVMKGSPNPELGARYALWYTSKDNAIDNIPYSQTPRVSLWESPVFQSGELATGLITPQMWKDTVLPLFDEETSWPMQYTVPGVGSIHQNTLAVFQRIWNSEARSQIPTILKETCDAMNRLLGR